MNIFIFGDSYFEEHMEEQEAVFTCSDMLREEYGSLNIINFGMSGTGPQYNLPLICDMIKNEKITSNDIIICHISGVTRVNFPWKNDTTINEFYWDSTLKKSFFNDEQGRDDTSNYYNNFQHEIDFAYLTFDKLLQVSGFAMVGFLYSISRCLNIKTIVFGNLNKAENMFSNFNDNKFHYSKYYLFDVSTREIFFNEVHLIVNTLKADKRKNHLSQENHKILFSYIEKFISGNMRLKHFTGFKENFRHAKDIFDVISENHPFKEKFIYD